MTCPLNNSLVVQDIPLLVPQWGHLHGKTILINDLNTKAVKAFKIWIIYELGCLLNSSTHLKTVVHYWNRYKSNQIWKPYPELFNPEKQQIEKNIRVQQRHEFTQTFRHKEKQNSRDVLFLAVTHIISLQWVTKSNEDHVISSNVSPFFLIIPLF